jgi:uncharacterized membrane protein
MYQYVRICVTATINDVHLRIIIDFESTLKTNLQHVLHGWWQVRALMSTFENRKAMYERFMEQLAQDIAMVALCQGQVVGLAVVNVDVDLQELSTNFALKQV